MLNKDKKTILLKAAYGFESLLAVVILIAVFLGTIDVLRVIWIAYIVEFKTPVEYNRLNDILGQILLLVIAIELVIMLSLHKPGALIDVLFYAIARKMVLLPKTAGLGDVLIGVIAIAGIFIIKRYLISEQEEKITANSISLDDEDKHYDEKQLSES